MKFKDAHSGHICNLFVASNFKTFLNQHHLVSTSSATVFGVSRNNIGGALRDILRNGLRLRFVNAVSKELVRTDSFSLTNLLCRDEISTRTQFYLLFVISETRYNDIC